MPATLAGAGRRLAMDDHEVLAHIARLTDEERQLEGSHHGDGELDTAKLARLESIRDALDQCWDLLRQRRARREVGLDPDGASLRGPDVVERYEQ